MVDTEQLARELLKDGVPERDIVEILFAEMHSEESLHAYRDGYKTADAEVLTWTCITCGHVYDGPTLHDVASRAAIPPPDETGCPGRQ